MQEWGLWSLRKPNHHTLLTPGRQDLCQSLWPHCAWPCFVFGVFGGVGSDGRASTSSGEEGGGATSPLSSGAAWFWPYLLGWPAPPHRPPTPQAFCLPPHLRNRPNSSGMQGGLTSLSPFLSSYVLKSFLLTFQRQLLEESGSQWAFYTAGEVSLSQ